LPRLFLGLISGTSVDAVDAALVNLERPAHPALLATHGLAPDPALRARILAASTDSDSVRLRELGELDQLVADWFADAATELLESQPAGVRDTVAAIGSHGQTLYHGADAAPPFTLQIGDPSRIAARTGLPTVAYFRQADMAAGGQGAPLAPAFHAEMLRDDTEHRCILNLGGIANITSLPPRTSAALVTGFDTGPSNGLLDGWIRVHRKQPQDTGGHWGNTGRVDETLVTRLLNDPFFALAPPKTTGREYFNLNWLQRTAGPEVAALAPEDVMRSLYELTARSVANAVIEHMPACQRVLLCGGGAHNPLLVARLQAWLGDRVVEPTDRHGIDGDWVEAATFAWLAMRRLDGLPGNLPSVTGARHPALLGGVFLPP
jgi:anhydro-N-acetylmuramic acid kinase